MKITFGALSSNYTIADFDCDGQYFCLAVSTNNTFYKWTPTSLPTIVNIAVLANKNVSKIVSNFFKSIMVFTTDGSLIVANVTDTYTLIVVPEPVVAGYSDDSTLLAVGQSGTLYGMKQIPYPQGVVDLPTMTVINTGNLTVKHVAAASANGKTLFILATDGNVYTIGNTYCYNCISYSYAPFLYPVPQAVLSLQGKNQVYGVVTIDASVYQWGFNLEAAAVTFDTLARMLLYGLTMLFDNLSQFKNMSMFLLNQHPCVQ